MRTFASIRLLVILGILLMSPSVLVDTAHAHGFEDSAMPQAAHWDTWVLDSASELRPEAPPDAATTAEELAALKEIVAANDATSIANVAYWDAGTPTYRWLELALAEYGKGPPSGYVSRGLALLNVAIYDAIIASWDAKYEYDRPRPSGVNALIDIPLTPSYPSEHAAAAGAASTVLAYLFPDLADDFNAKAEEAALSRVQAGVHYPSDVDAGLELGRQIGEAVVAWAEADGSDAEWTGTIPVGPDKWIGENPAGPTLPSWKTWVIESPDDYLPAPPPAIDGDQMAMELAELKAVERTIPIQINAFVWHSFDRAYTWWYDQLSRAMFEHHATDNIPEATKMYTAMAVTAHDTIVACFNGKYNYWMIRPPHLDEEITPLFNIPNHPSYPAAHSCNTMSAAMVISEYYPEKAEAIQAAAVQAGDSRIWAGIHYPSDNFAGQELGKAVAADVIERIGQMTQP